MYAVFDIDGCVSDDRWRRPRLETSYEAYHEVGSQDRPANREEIKWQRAHGRSIIYNTGRPEAYRMPTMIWLEEHGMWHPETDSLLMRPSHNHDHSVDLKIYLLNNHLEFAGITRDRVMMCYDNTEAIVGAYKDKGYRAQLLRVEDEPGAELMAGVNAKMNEPPDMPQPVALTAADVLEEMAKTFRERNAQYKNNYQQVVPMMQALFGEKVPADLMLKDHWHLFELIVVKLARFANSELNHLDSIHDIAVYAAMIEAELRGGK